MTSSEKKFDSCLMAIAGLLQSNGYPAVEINQDETGVRSSLEVFESVKHFQDFCEAVKEANDAMPDLDPLIYTVLSTGGAVEL
jgi:hypothetical protein